MPFVPFSGMEFLTELCRTLRLGDNVHAVTIRAEAQGFATMHVERILCTDEEPGIKSVLENYELRRIATAE
jgi:hypothetical protein